MIDMKKFLLSALFLLPIACTPAEDGGDDTAQPGSSEAQFVKGGIDGKADASVVASFLDFKFSGELLTTSSFNIERKIENQVLYTIGQLNGDNSVGRLDKLDLSNIDITRTADGAARVTYDASLLVAWGDKDNIPTTYTFQLPLDTRADALDAFAAAYGHDCVDFGAHDVDSGSMWYYYRPNARRCDFDDADIFEAVADVSVSAVNTTGKYPEYHKVWEDDVLRVVAVFGKYEDDATTSRDAGISAYNDFVRAVRREFDGVKTQPASIPTSPGVQVPDITFTADIGGGKSIEVVALMVDNIRTAGPDFDRRYEALSGKADLIAYNGHAGLGANIRALASKGRWESDQYAMVFMNGCDTYAYVDSALFDAHSAVNPNDPDGTQHLDLVTNAMPSFFKNMSASTMALMRGLMQTDDPMTYEQIFKNISSTQVILVSGEHDNVFVPGFGEDRDEPTEWGGLSADGEVTRDEEVRFETPVLAPGSYVFEMDGTRDADLYVKVGSAPSTKSFDCRPFRAGSRETCLVEINSPTTLHVMVRGWATSSTFVLEGSRK